MYFTVINKAYAANPDTYKSITVPFIVVSISSHEEKTCNIPEHDKLLDVLWLKFDDKMLCHYEGEAYPMTDGDAENLLQFIDSYKR